MEGLTGIYAMKVPLSQLDKLRTDAKFILILRLGRYLNQLSFCLQANRDYWDDNSPIGIRQQHNSLFFLYGVIYEAVKFRDELGKEFGTYKSFKNGLALLMKNKDFQSLREIELNYLRNKVVYHVDSMPYEETLKTLNLRKLDFFTTKGNEFIDVHFQLSDDIALNFMIGDHGTLKDEEAKFKEILEKIVRLSKEFVKHSHNLITEYIERKRWKVETR
ncbi:MAG TPA: hypothetical protein PKY59_21495 [Pyrinomonadaceae bacterium]|nr:hypothetical protein [Pyrinomonadaceae bacterium]